MPPSFTKRETHIKPCIHVLLDDWRELGQQGSCLSFVCSLIGSDHEGTEVMCLGQGRNSMINQSTLPSTVRRLLIITYEQKSKKSFVPKSVNSPSVRSSSQVNCHDTQRQSFAICRNDWTLGLEKRTAFPKEKHPLHVSQNLDTGCYNLEHLCLSMQFGRLFISTLAGVSLETLLDNYIRTPRVY